MRLHKRADRSGPEPSEGPWPLARIDVLQARDEEALASAFVDRAILEGWGTLDRGKLVLHTEPKLTYTITRPPGVYCCHCGEKLEAGNEVAQDHVAAEHVGETSPDPENPSGYCVTNFYVCEKVN